MLIYTYNVWFVALSFLIAIMASFTGLTLSRGLSGLSPAVRQLRIVLASLALGGGIWSMHFVAMLSMRFGVPVYFDSAKTVASALIAILLAGLALLIVHHAPPSRAVIPVSGAILGLGITAMHYLGMSAIQGCTPVFSMSGILLAAVLSVLFGIAAMAIAFGRQQRVDPLWSTLIFGAAVTVVHFTAMSQTVFLTLVNAPLASQAWDSQIAIMVMLAVFVISGGFLLVGANALSRAGDGDGMMAPANLTAQALSNASARRSAYIVPPLPRTSGFADLTDPEPVARPVDPALRLPYERDGRTNLVPLAQVYALHAEGHYTTAHLEHGPVFCPWSISIADEKLADHPGFMRVHRSWIVNLALVSAYERSKDHGYCVMAGVHGLERVPVSRNRMAALQKALGF